MMIILLMKRKQKSPDNVHLLFVSKSRHNIRFNTRKWVLSVYHLILQSKYVRRLLLEEIFGILVQEHVESVLLKD